jgi:hypothetical protein
MTQRSDSRSVSSCSLACCVSTPTGGRVSGGPGSGFRRLRNSLAIASPMRSLTKSLITERLSAWLRRLASRLARRSPPLGPSGARTSCGPCGRTLQMASHDLLHPDRRPLLHPYYTPLDREHVDHVVIRGAPLPWGGLYAALLHWAIRPLMRRATGGLNAADRARNRPFRAVITAASVRWRRHFVALGEAQAPSMQQCLSTLFTIRKCGSKAR